MLKPQQVPELKNADKTLYSFVRLLMDAINLFALQMGVDPRPASQVDIKDAIPAPAAPKSITVSVFPPIVWVVLEASTSGIDSTFYFVESSDTDTFKEVTTYALGHSLQIGVPEPPGTTYWRAFCRYQMSVKSPYVVWV